MNKNLDLSVIILNYNTRKLTIDTIKTFMKNAKNIEYEILVLDNGSKDDSLKFLNELAGKNENIKLQKSKVNLGFASGVNHCLKNVRSRYILLLNSDILIPRNVIHEMLSYMDQNINVGVMTCKLINIDGSVQGTGGYFPNLLRVFLWMTFLDDLPLIDRIVKPFHPYHTRSIYKNRVFYSKLKDIDWVTGAFFLMKGELIERVGIFDEDYFMYTEEVDYCSRIKNAGYRIVFNPKWNVVHLGAASSNSEFPIISEYKGVKLFFRKHKPLWQYIFLIGLLKLGAILRIGVFGVLNGREDAQIYAKAFKEA